EGDILAEIETDKATMEFESFYNGTLLYIGIEEGQSAPVDDVLAIIGPKGTDVDAVLASANGGGSTAPAAAAPKAEKAADQVEQVKEEQPKVAAQSATGGRVFVSPLAKKIAEEKGFDLSQIKGSGENGRIVKKDVENYTPAAKSSEANTSAASATAPAAPMAFVPAGEAHVEEKKNSQMRKTIARRLGQSKYSAPH